MLRFIDVFNFYSSYIQNSRIEILKDDDIAAFINAKRFVVKISFKVTEIAETAEALNTSAALKERVIKTARVKLWAESEERVSEIFLSRYFLLYLSRFLALFNIKNDEAIDNETFKDVCDDEIIDDEILRDSRARIL